MHHVSTVAYHAQDTCDFCCYTVFKKFVETLPLSFLQHDALFAEEEEEEERTSFSRF